MRGYRLTASRYLYDREALAELEDQSARLAARAEGYEEGRMEMARENARRAFAKGCSLEFVQEISTLPLAELQAIQAEVRAGV